MKSQKHSGQRVSNPRHIGNKATVLPLNYGKQKRRGNDEKSKEEQEKLLLLLSVEQVTKQREL